jgi:NAD(P)-dependent dehydrogenase (short-subunit alcohol dehydrogenase family)
VKRLDGKVALVTGGGGGIGRGICRMLAAEGAAIACVDLNAEAASETVRIVGEEGGQARAHRVDLANRAATHALFREIDRDFGRLDVLVNNAVWIQFDPIEKVEEAVVDRMLGIGLKALLWTTQAALPALSRQGGSIINVASIAALRGTAERIVYSAVKGAVVSMTLEAAVELGPRKIRVNAIAPGAMLANPGTAARLGPERIKLRLQTTPLGRLGTPEDMAGVVLFLSSDDSRFVTGTVIPVDGGRLIVA